jgi:hypothetical protein
VEGFDPDELRIEAPVPTTVVESTGGRRSKAKYDPGFLKIPAQMMVRHWLNPLPPNGWLVLLCLINLEYRAGVKEQPIALSNYAAAKWALSQERKMLGLEELAKREFLTYTTPPGASPQVKVFKHLWK